MVKMINLFYLFIMLFTANLTSVGQTRKGADFLIRVSGPTGGACGYRNVDGRIEIPLGKYSHCFTDTFRNYAIVIDSVKGMVGIDRHDSILYNIFIFDNGPDYPSNGLFRINVAGKIGFADAATGKVVVKPQFACAWPFEHGLAKVALDCQTHRMEEHSTWVSDHWFYINKAGVRINKHGNSEKNK
jgi:hypothetical protein